MKWGNTWQSVVEMRHLFWFLDHSRAVFDVGMPGDGSTQTVEELCVCNVGLVEQLQQLQEEEASTAGEGLAVQPEQGSNELWELQVLEGSWKHHGKEDNTTNLDDTTQADDSASLGVDVIVNLVDAWEMQW